MARYYGKHKVRDYDHWRPYFDADQERINATGARCLRVLRAADDPNDVHFIFDIPDFEAFMRLLQQDDTQRLLQQAGVLEQPEIYRLQELVPEPVAN